MITGNIHMYATETDLRENHKGGDLEISISIKTVTATGVLLRLTTISHIVSLVYGNYTNIS